LAKGIWSLNKRPIKITAALTVIVLAGGGYLWFGHARSLSPERQWALFDGYCVECHNRDDYTANIAFDAMGPESIAEEPEVFEAAVRKLRGHMMPPPGWEQPEHEAVDSVVRWLETSLDEHAAQHPNPGYIALHRLNRTEYGNAIEDLFGMRVDVAALLPRDDESDGFDNVANVLKVSPSFLEQYISAARVVSAEAVGDPNAKLDARVYYPQPGTKQNVHIDGMPLGTRGGMQVEHYFPADGTYEISIGGLVQAGYVVAVEHAFKLLLLIDGVKVFEQQIGGEADLKNIDQRQATAVAEIASRFDDIPVDVTAGTHEVAVTFGARTFAESDDTLQPFTPGTSEPRVIRASRLEIVGPFNPTNVSLTPSRERIFVCRPGNETEELPCARQIFAKIARQAFRRPVTGADLEAPLRFFGDARERAGFEAGIRSGLVAILASPKFLYRAEPAPTDLAPGSIYAIGDIELASRLSFFLWSRLPDEELLSLAEQGTLSEPQVLRAQVRRMLASPNAKTLVTNFAVQWLDLRGLSGIDPDTDLFPSYTKDLSNAFEAEMAMFLESILLEDRSVLDLLDAEHTFVNETLALHYGIGDIRGAQFRRIELDDPNRWGLLGKGSVLMVTSYPNRTAPVLRGAWILESILGTPPASPPPNVEALPETQEGGEVLTVRERLEIHRTNPTCNGCHGVMDPLGFALENFDAIGEWRARDRDAGDRIDASGQLADGTLVNGPQDLRKALLARSDQFVQTLTEKLMIYALGRTVEYHDMPAIRKVVRQAAEEDYTFESIVTALVNSEPFRMKRLPGIDEELTSRQAAAH
jgi:hypothetical protein